MALGTATWIPGFEVHHAEHGGAGPYTDLVHVKFVWHTSESAPGSIDAIIAMMQGKRHSDVYHALVDPMLRRRAQLLPLNVSASALAHPPSVETNHDGAVQVCIIGRADDMPRLSAADLAWLGGDVLAPIVRMVPELNYDVKATFYGKGAGFTLATANARQRMTPAAWDNFNGQAGHQHVPGNDHWDPGALDVSAITRAAHVVIDFPGAVPTPGDPGGSTSKDGDDMVVFINPKSKNALRPQYCWLDKGARQIVLEGGLNLKGVKAQSGLGRRFVSVPTSGVEISGWEKHADGLGCTVIDVKDRAYVYRWA